MTDLKLAAQKADCTHERILTWSDEETCTPVLWSCARCSRKFVPLEVATPPLLQKEEGDGKDAARYRWLRELPNADALNIRFCGVDLDHVVDASIATRQGEKP